MLASRANALNSARLPAAASSSSSQQNHLALPPPAPPPCGGICPLPRPQSQCAAPTPPSNAAIACTQPRIQRSNQGAPDALVPSPLTKLPNGCTCMRPRHSGKAAAQQARTAWSMACRAATAPVCDGRCTGALSLCVCVCAPPPRQAQTCSVQISSSPEAHTCVWAQFLHCGHDAARQGPAGIRLCWRGCTQRPHTCTLCALAAAPAAAAAPTCTAAPVCCPPAQGPSPGPQAGTLAGCPRRS